MKLNNIKAILATALFGGLLFAGTPNKAQAAADCKTLPTGFTVHVINHYPLRGVFNTLTIMPATTSNAKALQGVAEPSAHGENHCLHFQPENQNKASTVTIPLARGGGAMTFITLRVTYSGGKIVDIDVQPSGHATSEGVQVKEEIKGNSVSVLVHKSRK